MLEPTMPPPTMTTSARTFRVRRPDRSGCDRPRAGRSAPSARRPPAQAVRRMYVYPVVGGLVELPVLHDCEEAALVLEDSHVHARVTVHQQEVGEAALADEAELVPHAHDLAAVAGAGLDRLHRRHAEQVHEVLEVLGVRPHRGPGEPVVAADEDPDPAPVHLLHGLDRVLELALVGDGEGGAGLDPPLRGVARDADEPREPGRDEVLFLVGLEHVEGLGVGERGVVDVLDAVAHALLDRLRGARVGGEGLVAPPRLADRHRDLLVRHRRLLRLRSR